LRLVIEIWNGCIQSMVADERCEVLVIDRDELVEETLPDGGRGYVSGWDVPSDPDDVNESYAFAGFARGMPDQR